MKYLHEPQGLARLREESTEWESRSVGVLSSQPGKATPPLCIFKAGLKSPQSDNTSNLGWGFAAVAVVLQIIKINFFSVLKETNCKHLRCKEA